MGTHFSLVLRGKCPACVLMRRPVISIPSKDKPSYLMLKSRAHPFVNVPKLTSKLQNLVHCCFLTSTVFNLLISSFLGSSFIFWILWNSLLYSLSLWYFLYHFKIIFSLHLKSLFFPSFPSCSSILLVYSF